MLYTSDLLTELSGKSIQKLKFYCKSNPYFGGAQYTISLGEIDGTTINSSFSGTVTAVATAVTLNASITEWEIDFSSTPYTYNGGNLVIQTYCTKTNSVDKSTFYGVESGSSWSSHGSNNGTNVSYTFLPKLTITYGDVSSGLVTIKDNLSSLSFGEVKEGGYADNSLLTLVNTTDADVTVNASDIATTGDFAVVGGPFTVAANGGETAIPLRFTPTTAGSCTGSATITVGNRTLGPVSLSGTGVAATSISGSSLEFGNVVIGNSATLTDITLANTSTSPISATASVNGPFSLPDGTSFTIPAEANAYVVPVQYNPTAAVEQTGTLTINAGWSTYSVALSGTGVEQVIDYAAKVNPTTLNFGSVYTGITTKPTKTIVLTNTGDKPFTPIVGATSNAAYTVSGPAGELSSKDSRTYTITFAPEEAAICNGNFHITTSLQEGDLDMIVTLNGEGTDDASVGITVTPEVLDFGTVNAGSSSTQSFIVTNDGGAADATISVASPYSVVSNNVALATGDNTINVTFAPTDASSHTTNLTLTVNGNDYHVALTGIGNKEGELATRDSVFFSKIDYTWTDANGGNHTNNLAEIATDPDQMIAMLTEVYTNQSIPGNKYRGYASDGTPNPDEVAYGAVGPVVQVATGTSTYEYAYDPNKNGFGGYGWNIPPKGEIVSGTDKPNSTTTYNLRYFNPADYKPANEGLTMLLVEMKDGVTSTNLKNIGAGTYANERARLRAYFNTMIKSVRVITDAKTIGKDDDRSAGTLFKIDCDKMNRFFMLGKGRLRLWDVAVNSDERHTGIPEAMRWDASKSESYASFINRNLGENSGQSSSDVVYNPFYNMFEQFSPYDLASTQDVADLYKQLVTGATFPVYHDCQSVMAVDNGHEFNMYGRTSTSDDCQDVRGLMFIVPKYRMTWFFTSYQDSRDGRATETTNGHMNYSEDMYINYYKKGDVDLRPTMGLFSIIQDPIEPAERVGTTDWYQLQLNWHSNLLNFLPGDQGEYKIFEVITTDGQETYKPVYYTDAQGNYVDKDGAAVTEPIQVTIPATKTSDENEVYQYVYVPMQEHGYEVTYAIQAEDADGFMDLAMSNKQSFIIPGTNLSEKFEVKLNDDYTSRFEPQGEYNYYSNGLRVRNYVDGVNESYLSTGMSEQFKFYRVAMTPKLDAEGNIIYKDADKTQIDYDVDDPVLFAAATVLSKEKGEGELAIVEKNDQIAKDNFPKGKTSGVNGGRAGYHANAAKVPFRYSDGGIVSFGSTDSEPYFVVYDNFRASTAQNTHPTLYVYYATLETAVSFTGADGETTTAVSNEINVNIPKTNMEMKGVLSLAQVNRDGKDGNPRSQLSENTEFTIDVTYASKTELLRYDAYRWTDKEIRYVVDNVDATDNMDEEDIAPNGEADNQLNSYTIKMNGEDTQATVAIDKGQTVAAPFLDNYPNQHAGTYLYAPVIEYFNGNPDKYDYYNTYGAPLKSTVSGELQVEVDPLLNTDKDHPLMSEYAWYDNGEWCSYYNIPLKFTALNIPDGYQLYKVRAWRQVSDPSILREEISSRDVRKVDDYLFEDMNYGFDMGNSEKMCKENLAPEKNYQLGSRPVSADEFEVVETFGTIQNETHATFGAQRMKGVEYRPGNLDQLSAKFVVRAYFTRQENPALNQPIYVIGNQPNSSTWLPNHSLATLSSLDGQTYTGLFTPNASSDGYAYFSFVNKLSSSEAGWDDIKENRIQPEAATQEAPASNVTLKYYDGGSNSFKIAAGKTYLITISNFAARTGNGSNAGTVTITDVNSSANVPRHAAQSARDYDYYVAEGETDWKTFKASDGVITGISTPVQDRSCDVVGVTYVNPMGQTSSRPFGGVNIIVTRYSDGTTKTTKAVY